MSNLNDFPPFPKLEKPLTIVERTGGESFLLIIDDPLQSQPATPEQSESVKAWYESTIAKRMAQMDNPEFLLQFFTYDHLPVHLQAISKPFCDLAYAIVYGDNHPNTGTVTIGSALPRNPERTVTLRKLLEAKDAAVRTVVAK